MDKKTKTIPINAIAETDQQPESVIVGALLSTLSDIDQDLDQHLNAEGYKSKYK